MTIPHEVNISVVDDKGVRGRTTFFLDGDVSDLVALQLAASAIADAMSNVITGKITRISLLVQIPVNDSGEFRPLDISDIEDGAKVFYECEGGFRSEFRIPTFDEEFVNSGTNKVDTTESTFPANFFGLFQSGDEYNDVVVRFTDARGAVVTKIIKALEDFRP